MKEDPKKTKNLESIPPVRMPSEDACHEKPRSTLAAEALGRSSGKSAQDIFRSGLAQMRVSLYPTEECIRVSDVEEYVLNGHAIPGPIMEHVDRCVPCRIMLELARPKPENEDAFVEAVDQADAVLRALAKDDVSPSSD